MALGKAKEAIGVVKGNVVGHRLNFSAHKSLKRQSLANVGFII